MTQAYSSSLEERITCVWL